MSPLLFAQLYDHFLAVKCFSCQQDPFTDTIYSQVCRGKAFCLRMPKISVMSCIPVNQLLVSRKVLPERPFRNAEAGIAFFPMGCTSRISKLPPAASSRPHLTTNLFPCCSIRGRLSVSLSSPSKNPSPVLRTLMLSRLTWPAPLPTISTSAVVPGHPAKARTCVVQSSSPRSRS